ncbi:MAG: DoxX family membrane protein [Vicinamibacterales bacterium]
MDALYFFVMARVLLASVFVGLGIERLLSVSHGGAISVGALAFGLLEFVAGLMLVFGWQTRWVALSLAVFLLVDALLSHSFWRFTGATRHDQLLHFLKNTSMLGGFALLAWVESRS